MKFCIISAIVNFAKSNINEKKNSGWLLCNGQFMFDAPEMCVFGEHKSAASQTTSEPLIKPNKSMALHLGVHSKL